MQKDTSTTATGVPMPVEAARMLFFLNAGIWTGFALFTVTGMASRYPDQTATLWILGILMVGNALFMVLAGIGVGKRGRLAYYFSLALLVVNIVLTFTDQFGAFDLVTLLLDVGLLALLVVTRAHYLTRAT
jgi:hypothetical protein